MRAAALICQCGTLADAETVLFIRDDQAEAAEGDILLNQRMRAHGQVDLTALQLRFDLLFFRCAGSAGQQGAADARRAEKALQRVIMLLCQNAGGRHQGALKAVFGGSMDERRRHRGFTGADVPLQQSAHRRCRAHIAQAFRNRAPLCAGGGEGKQRKKSFTVVLRHP